MRWRCCDICVGMASIRPKSPLTEVLSINVVSESPGGEDSWEFEEQACKRVTRASLTVLHTSTPRKVPLVVLFSGFTGSCQTRKALDFPSTPQISSNLDFSIREPSEAIPRSFQSLTFDNSQRNARKEDPNWVYGYTTGVGLRFKNDRT